MEGYDWTTQGSLWGMLEFRQKFGDYIPELDDWQAPAAWQSAIGSGPSIGSIFGVYWGAFLNDHYGYRKSLMINYALVIPIIALMVFAQNKEMLLAGGCLIGVPFGAFACLGEAYASEICPMKLRGYMTGYVMICWMLGGFIGTSVTTGTESIASDWSWRIPYICQWIWPVPLFVLSYFAPESPWWLVKNGRLEEAEATVKRLGGSAMRDRAAQTVANMVHTCQVEKDLANNEGQGRWREIFQSSNLRRTEITTFVQTLQNFSGAMLAGQGAYVLQQAGIDQGTAYDLGWGASAVQLGSNFLCFYLLYKFGRRPIYTFGFVYSAVIMLLVGVTAVLVENGHTGARWAQAAMIMAFQVGYTGFLGPTCYAIIGETSSVRLRNKTIAFARMVYAIQGIVFGILNGYMINPTAFDWKGKTGFFWAPCAALAAVWCYYRLPETKDRTYYELDILFEQRISARKFSSTYVDANANVALEMEQQSH